VAMAFSPPPPWPARDRFPKALAKLRGAAKDDGGISRPQPVGWAAAKFCPMRCFTSPATVWLLLALGLASPVSPARASNAQADAGAQSGSITIALKKVLNVGNEGKMVLDLINHGDGRLYISLLDGKILCFDPVGGNVYTYLDMGRAGAKLALPTTNAASGFYGFAFHPNFDKPGQPGYQKIYTWGDELKSTTTGRGARLAALPDFWHPENYVPGAPVPSVTNVRKNTFAFFNVLREWTVNTAAKPPVVDPNSSRVLLRITEPGATAHNGAPPRFGPDGLLYFALGDGGGNGNDFQGTVDNPNDGHTNGTGNGQDLTNIYGKVLRLDPLPTNQGGKLSANGQYRIPADNPFADGANGKLPEIFAYGFRNPWKINFDDRPGGTGKLYLSDVGQKHREEIDVVVKGGNYGWGYMEGSVPLINNQNYSGEKLGPGIEIFRSPPGGFANFKFIPPLVEYKTRGQYYPDGAPRDVAHLVGDGVSITLGCIYRGSALPALAGQLVFGEYSWGETPPPGHTPKTGRLFYLDPAQPDPKFYEFQLAPGSKIPAQLLGFGQNAQGEIYVFFDNGEIDEIVPATSAK